MAETSRKAGASATRGGGGSRVRGSGVTAVVETAVHYRYVEPLLATVRIPSSGEVAEGLGVPVEDVRRALRSLADTDGGDDFLQIASSAA
jgi:hypothetical protein